jgi:hypothetical protein
MQGRVKCNERSGRTGKETRSDITGTRFSPDGDFTKIQSLLSTILVTNTLRVVEFELFSHVDVLAGIFWWENGAVGHAPKRTVRFSLF